jgi:hypothetical protein
MIGRRTAAPIPAAGACVQRPAVNRINRHVWADREPSAYAAALGSAVAAMQRPEGKGVVASANRATIRGNELPSAMDFL